MPGRHHTRDAYGCEQRLRIYRTRHPKDFLQFELAPDLKHGEVRLAAEVAIVIFKGLLIPVSDRKAYIRAREKALDTFNHLAKD